MMQKSTLEMRLVVVLTNHGADEFQQIKTYFILIIHIVFIISPQFFRLNLRIMNTFFTIVNCSIDFRRATLLMN